MSVIKRRTGRHFTEAARAARAAAVTSRRETIQSLPDMTAPEVFVVRLNPSAAAFTWEIRQFGGVVVSRGDGGFSSMTQARSTGILALAALVPS